MRKKAARKRWTRVKKKSSHPHQENAGGTYLAKRGIASGIQKMNLRDREPVVTGVLDAMLGGFFGSQDGYLTRAEQVANEGFTDLLVLHYDENGKESHFLVVQCKRLSREGSAATWNEAKDQLKRYLPSLKPRDKKRRVFGVIAVGRYVQFVEYELHLVDAGEDPLSPVEEQTEKLHIKFQCQTVARTFQFIRDHHDMPNERS